MTAKEAASLAPERMTAKEAAGVALQRRAALPSGRAGAGHDRGEPGRRAGTVRATAQTKGVALNDEPALEVEADVMGARAAQGEARVQRAYARDVHAPAGALQRKATIEDTDPNAAQGQGRGALVSTDASTGQKKEHAVAFGPLKNGCGTWMDAWLYPDDKPSGSKPSVQPAWWAPMMNDPATDKQWVSNYVVQGHLLNENLGGPGNDMRNLTPIAKSTNTQHHNFVEKPAKNVKKNGNILEYKVNVDYSQPPPPAWFGNKIAPTYLHNFAYAIECVLQEYDAKTEMAIGSRYETTITNAMKDQG
ncbi:hypothetical protein [Sorangium sp. So ce861]|uniref:hypothetical protein n=1 Tax=Sorangium sp. So ce861 TaxID=3133323 RepID=UPI003F622F2E